MMPNHNFDKDIKRVLDTNTPNADYANLWNKLEPRINKRKKRPVFFIFISILFLAAFYFCNLPDVSKTKNKSSIQNVEPISKTNTNQKPVVVINNLQNYSEVAEAKPLINVQINKPLRTLRINNKNIKEGMAPILITEDDVNSADHKFTSDLINEERKRIDVNNLRSNEASTANEPNELSFSKASMQDLIDVNNDHVKIEALHTYPRMLYINEKTALCNINIVKNSNTKISKKQALQFFEISMLSYYALSSKTKVFDIYNQKMSDAIGDQMGYRIHLACNYIINKNISIGIGMNLSQGYEKFKLNNMFTTIKKEQNLNAFELNGNFISAIQDYKYHYTQEIVHYNAITNISFHPSINIKFKRPFDFETNIGLDVPVYQNYKGTLFSPSGFVIKSGELFQQRRFKAFSPSINISKPIYSNEEKLINLFLGYQYLQNESFNDSPFNGNAWHLINIGLGYRW
jgi:hypothetical protein